MKRIVFSAAALCAAALIALTGCSASGGGAAPSSSPGSTFKVGIDGDVGGFNDHGFNSLSLSGVKLAKSKYKVDFASSARESKSETDYVPNLQYFGQNQYNLVIVVGFGQGTALGQVAPQYPNTKFAIVDVDVADDPVLSKLSNVEGITFKEQEGGYLAGVLIGELRKSGYAKMSGPAISTVGGEKQPPVDHYIAGFDQGAKAADPSVKTLNAYSQSFSDQNACKQIANTQIAQGSSVVFSVAGNCGLGALAAAKDAGVWGIGVDTDQSFLGDYILTSVVKRVDQGVAQVIKDVEGGTFKGGSNTVYGLANGGVGLGKIKSDVPQSALDAVTKAEAGIKDGSIKVDDTVG